jgi:hypothetical protein
MLISLLDVTEDREFKRTSVEFIWFNSYMIHYLICFDVIQLLIQWIEFRLIREIYFLIVTSCNVLRYNVKRTFGNYFRQFFSLGTTGLTQLSEHIKNGCSVHNKYSGKKYQIIYLYHD